ncbi:Fe-S cluster assembly protein HesB [Herbiconiux sp. CPCC 205763]|uniref:Fe-S cluster assembly protein HesB n=1 Tax=Herbiconiux aconitum TaxID=2970913 RepID=A0ABT2GRA8_9MICO|nr:Fe-S cluster assembly protein HesB [Herbiconiux aconitum]MCS5717825.1 Fe-S cluster assembly protein HesB [Herbiconiux aconitum]
MLTLTENAGAVVKNLADRTLAASGDSDTTTAAEGGLRISTADSSNFEVAVAPRPQPTDQVVESSGARVYLEPGAADALSDKVLDAEVDENGSVHFSLGVQ